MHVQNITLAAGEFHASKEACIVESVATSGVVVFLYAPKLKAGAVAHFLEPGADVYEQPGKAGLPTLQRLVARFNNWGCTPEELRAWVFGGAQQTYTGAQYNVGPANRAFAKQALQGFRIKIIQAGPQAMQPCRVRCALHSGATEVEWLDSAEQLQPGASAAGGGQVDLGQLVNPQFRPQEGPSNRAFDEPLPQLPRMNKLVADSRLISQPKPGGHTPAFEAEEGPAAEVAKVQVER